jgi:hypothetical protein
VQVHLLGYEDGGLAGADYNNVRSSFVTTPAFANCVLQVLRDVVQELRLARADVVFSFFPLVAQLFQVRRPCRSHTNPRFLQICADAAFVKRRVCDSHLMVTLPYIPQSLYPAAGPI